MKDREKYFAALVQPAVVKMRRTGGLFRRWEVVIRDCYGIDMFPRYALTERRAKELADKLMRPALEVYENRLREQLTKEW
jgi:hypothetical protein